MKKTTLFLSLLWLSSAAFACGLGCTEYEGTCACDAKPAESPAQVDQSAWVSDEKPSRHPEPAYQRGEVNALMLPSLAAQDMKQDQEARQADAQGKIAAGLK